MRILYYGADVRSVAFIFAALACYALGWLGIVRNPLIVAAGMGLAFIACVINHNHRHHPTFISKRLNSAFGVLISLAAGVPGTVVVAMHNLNHHQHNNDEQDYVRASLVTYRWRWLNLLLFPLIAIAQFAVVKARVLKGWKAARPRLYRQLMLERIVLYGALMVLLILKPLETLLYLGVPWLFGQWCILAINHLQHVDCDPSSRYNHSRNIVSRWSNWWFFNNGLHTAHHQRPGLHWSRLPQYHAQLAPHIDPQLNCPSLLGVVARLYLLPQTPVSTSKAGEYLKGPIA